MRARVAPARLAGEVPAIPSKSDAHRLMIASYLSARPMEAPYPSADLEATQRCLKALSAGDEPVLRCGESGSTLRFLLPVAAALGKSARFEGEGRLPDRPLGPILDEMERHGVRLSDRRLPLTLDGRLQSGLYRLPGNVSSQFVTGLLFALPLLQGDSRVELTSRLESAEYVEMTLRTLKTSGVHVERRPNGYFVPGDQRFQCPAHAKVEGDWSNAAFFLAAGFICRTTVRVSGLDIDSCQSDREIAALLKTLLPGAPFEVDVSNCPDLFPVLCVLAASARGKSVLRGGRRLRIKESDRIHAMEKLLAALGGHAQETEDGLIVWGVGGLRGGVVEGENDHRIVMAAAIAACLCQEPVLIHGAEAVNKSYPDFFRDLNRLGGKADVI